MQIFISALHCFGRLSICFKKITKCSKSWAQDSVGLVFLVPTQLSLFAECQEKRNMCKIWAKPAQKIWGMPALQSSWVKNFDIRRRKEVSTYTTCHPQLRCNWKLLNLKRFFLGHDLQKAYDNHKSIVLGLWHSNSVVGWVFTLGLVYSGTNTLRSIHFARDWRVGLFDFELFL